MLKIESFNIVYDLGYFVTRYSFLILIVSEVVWGKFIQIGEILFWIRVKISQISQNSLTDSDSQKNLETFMGIYNDFLPRTHPCI